MTPRHDEGPPPTDLSRRIVAVAAPELVSLAGRARRRLRAGLAALLALPAAIVAWPLALAPAEGPRLPRPDAQWLAQRVGADGRFADGSELPVSEVGLHGLALLALARGDEAGASRDALVRAGDWLLDQQAGDGALASADADHALATLALVEAWQATHESHLRAGAEKAHENLLQREAWGGRGGELAAAWSLEALLTAREAGLDGAAAAEDRARERLLAELGGPVDRSRLRQAAISPRAVPRQAGLGELYVASVSLLANPPPDDAGR